MPGLANVITDELLPSIFRRRRFPRLPTQPIGNDLPEQGGYGGNLLQTQTPTQAPPTPDIQVRPDQVRPQPTTPVVQQPPDTGTAANILAAKTTVQPTAATTAEPTAPNVLSPPAVDKRGRPIPNPALSGDEQTLDYYKRVASMPDDTKGGGWWPKIRAAIAGFAAGGPVGAAAAFGTRSLREHFDPTLGSREYRRQKLGELEPAVKSIQDTRKEARLEESQAAQTDLAKARTEALKHPKPNARIIERKDGVYSIDPDGTVKKIAGIPPEAGSPGSTHYITRKDGVYGINAEHPEGFKVKGIPGEAGKGEEDVTFTNAQINAVIKRKQLEQKKIDDALVGIPQTIDGEDILTGMKKKVPNPEYTYNMTRRRKLDDDIDSLRTKLKNPKSRAAASTNANDPLGLFDDEEPPQ